MNEVTLVLSVWAVTAVSFLLTGAGMMTIARTFRPNAWPGYVLGLGYLTFGVVRKATIVYAVYRYMQGHNPAYEGIGYVAYFLIGASTLFNVFQTGIVVYSAHRARTLTPAETETVLAAIKIFATLRRAVDATK